MPQPPPLPPRSPSVASTVSSCSSNEGSSRGNRPRINTIHLTPYTTYSSPGDKQNYPYDGATGFDDPRTSSTQSLRPVVSAAENQRKLLLIYIHGFMGTETSFKSFPAHVHNLLSMSLADSHVVHTKIYPRYRSRKNISFARDAFSNWLTPHESDNTDVILIGHSLGGILAAEVVLLPSHRPGSNDLFQHRILGHIAYDTPFLGMHPGVVSAGIASLFKPAPDPPDAPKLDQSNTAGLSFNPFEEEPNDPNYNPAYGNDVKLPVRKGKLDQAFHFLSKHYGDVRRAATSYVKSHLEFGGCLADFEGLKKRYRSFRPLEDIDEMADNRTNSGKKIPRVRFVNYYTASTGRIKSRPTPGSNSKVLVAETEMTETRQSLDLPRPDASSHQSTPRISLSEHRGDELIEKDLDDSPVEGRERETDMQCLQPQAEPTSPVPGVGDEHSVPPVPTITTDASPITPEPSAHEKHERERLKKEEERMQKEQERLERGMQKQEMKRSATVNQEQYDAALARQAEAAEREQQSSKPTQAKVRPPKKQRDRKFCTLPKKDDKTGMRDRTWIRVYMENMDEVQAHTSLFFVSDTYAKLVGDTAERIEQWVRDEATVRAVREAHAWEQGIK